MTLTEMINDLITEDAVLAAKVEAKSKSIKTKLLAEIRQIIKKDYITVLEQTAKLSNGICILYLEEGDYTNRLLINLDYPINWIFSAQALDSICRVEFQYRGGRYNLFSNTDLADFEVDELKRLKYDLINDFKIKFDDYITELINRFKQEIKNKKIFLANN